MIKLALRTELVAPLRGGTSKVVAKLGDTVRAGSTILAEFVTDTAYPMG